MPRRERYEWITRISDLKKAGNRKAARCLELTWWRLCCCWVLILRQCLLIGIELVEWYRQGIGLGDLAMTALQCPGMGYAAAPCIEKKRIQSISRASELNHTCIDIHE
jgi:hypothetical protein